MNSMNTCKNLYSSVPWNDNSQMPSDLTIPIDIEWNNINLEDLGADTHLPKHSAQYNLDLNETRPTYSKLISLDDVFTQFEPEYEDPLKLPVTLQLPTLTQQPEYAPKLLHNLEIHKPKPVETINQSVLTSSNNELMTKVDILNQIILDTSNNFYPECLPSQVSTVQSNDYIIKAVDVRRKITKNKAISKQSYKTKCSVCGNESSGYHYGSHTCEACKLFFRRTEKRIRKTGFTDCQKKNCQITSQSRANCSQCRYKKCIAAGMSMTRSRYGRHTEREASSYLPNINESLSYLVEQVRTKFSQQAQNMNGLNDLVVEFYLKSIKLLKIIETSEESQDVGIDLTFFNADFMDFPTRVPVSSTEAISSQKLLLPKCIILLFCFLFEMSPDFINDVNFVEILIDFRNFINFIQQNILFENKFVPMLKIGLFIKTLRILFEDDPTKEDPIDKRITDLMRSEFALFKFNSNDSTTLALLFSQINHILYKHMTEQELNMFIVNKCPHLTSGFC